MKRQKNKLLLHACCADCAIRFLSSLDQDFDVSLYFDNDNIHPRSEYLARLQAVQQISKDNNINLIIANWSPKQWFKTIEFNEDNNRNRRCKLCWRHRLSKTFEYAKNNGFKYFSTTLLTSHYQNKKEITKIGKSLERGNLKFLAPVLFKDIKTKGFYKQNYCGCVYSLKDRYFEKYSS